MPILKQQCSTCKYWSNRNDPSLNTGLCKLNPPTITVEGTNEGLFPFLAGYQLCGQWEVKSIIKEDDFIEDVTITINKE